MNDLDELNFTPLPPVTDQDLAMVRGVVNSNRLHMIKGLASVPPVGGIRLPRLRRPADPHSPTPSAIPGISWRARPRPRTCCA